MEWDDGTFRGSTKNGVPHFGEYTYDWGDKYIS